MSKAVINGAGEATVSDTTVVDNLFLAITTPLKSFSSVEEGEPATYYSENAVGQAVLAAIAGGFVIGDRFGDRVPFLGGHR